MKAATGWDFYFFRARLGLKYAVAGIDLERCIEFPWCFNRLSQSARGALLDIGARNSVFPLFAAARSNFSVTAIDVDPMIIEQADFASRAARGISLDMSRLRYEVMDATAMTFSDNTFDVATAISAVEHIPGEGDSAAIREIHRVLKPGGRLILTVPAFREHREEFHNRRVYNREYNGEPVFFEHVYDAESARKRLLEAAPFRVAELTCFGQPAFDFSSLWWLKMPFTLKLPVRWATPVFASAFYNTVDSPADSRGISIVCAVLEK